jgi:2Fe-2S ferredoxin
MAKIIYREANGTDHIREVAAGTSLMRGAVDSDVPGITTECGGSAACGACKVRIDGTWISRVPPAGELEISMLDEEDVAANIRLSCQIEITPQLGGLVVGILTK